MIDPDERYQRRSETDVGAVAAPGGGTRTYQFIDQRYVLIELLGRGGMGSVHRARERATGREVALKQLRYPERMHDRAALEAMFEREYRTLSELEHPRVIRVFDYGLDPSGPYYTMELLEGSSLTECSPLPWREACALIHDVCSSLALLHSRRLIHRDVTPSNVRRTADGRAKLIDFGAMAVMGANLPPVGTLGFTAPEVLDRLTLDARTDLFSLGALFYFVLTGRPPYVAHSFTELRESWAIPPQPPSSIVPDIPAGLESLVLRMLSLEPAERPGSAWEVMQPMAAWAGLARDQDIDASRAYLATPIMIGREDLLADVRRQVRRALRRRGRSILLEGEPGSGRTRLLDASAWAAQTQGVLIIRAGGRGASKAPFALLAHATNLLIDAAPDLFQDLSPESAAFFVSDGQRPQLVPFAAATLQERTGIQEVFTRLWLTLADRRPIALAIDDVDRIDAASAGWVATLADRVRRHRLLLLCSCERRQVDVEASAEAIGKRSKRHLLSPLTAAEVERLIGSIFGDVAHVSLLADRIFRIAGGNPGASMELARSLVERKLVRYDAGAWVLPAQLELHELPSTVDQAFSARVAMLSSAARRLAGYHALSRFGPLSYAEQERLFEGESPAGLGHARSELLASDVLALDADNTAVDIASDAWRRALSRALSPQEAQALHLRLAELGASTAKPIVAIAYHYFAGERADRGLDILLALVAQDTDRNELLMTPQLPLPAMAQIFLRAVDSALQLGRPARHIAELRRWLCMISSIDDSVSFPDVSPAWLETLRRDSGLQDWLELAEVSDPGARLMQALTRAGQRHSALPEAERTYRVDEAIRHLVGYTVNVIAYGTRTCDASLTRTLPPLLAPFARLSPLVDVMLGNCEAAYELAALGHYTQARERWRSVYERLQNIQGEALRYAPMIRSAIAFGIGCLEAALGLATAEQWAAPMEAAPLTFIDALYLRRVVRLAAGDFEAAERYARQAELRAVQAAAKPVFSAMHSLEISIYTLAGDIAALKPVVDKVRVLAQKHSGWRVHVECAEGCLELLRGDYLAAEQSLARALTLCIPDDSQPQRSVSPFSLSAGMYANALLALERYADARAFARSSLQLMAARDIRSSDMVVRALALAEARLGNYAAAIEHIEALIVHQRELGVAGLMLGVSYEARALIALWAADRNSLRTYAQLAAACYRLVPGSPIRGRYLQLLAEARRAGLEAEVTLAETATAAPSANALRAMVASRLQDAGSSQQRAAAALQLIRERAHAEGGHIYLILPDGELVFAASNQAPPPTAAELSHAASCLERAQSEASLTTELVSESSSVHLGTLHGWTIASGGVQHGMLITAASSHEARHIAVVLINNPVAEFLTRLRSILFAIGERMLLEDSGLGALAID